MIHKVIVTTLLALPLVLTSAAEAQQQKQAKPAKQTQYTKQHVNEMEVRHECVLQAQAMHPGIYASGDGTMNARTAAYASCVTAKGVRP